MPGSKSDAPAPHAPATPPAPIPNPNTSHQPTVGARHDVIADELDSLQTEQNFAYQTLQSVMQRLESGDIDREGAPYGALVATEALLHDGGTQQAVQDGADAFEQDALYALTPTLESVDLAGLNAVLTSLRFISTHLRTGASLAALPEAPPTPLNAPPGVHEGAAAEPPSSKPATPPAPPAAHDPKAHEAAHDPKAHDKKHS